MEDFIGQYSPYIIGYGLNALVAIIILIIGWTVANWVEKKIRKKGDQSEKLDDTLTRLFAQVAKIAIMAVVIIAVLERFGVETTSLVALIGGLGLAIGLAWQGVLADFASGIMILVMRPFKVGDAIDCGSANGVVDEIGVISTQMHTFDNVAMFVPNSEIWGNVISNYAANDNRRVDMTIGFGYDDDIDEAYRVIKEVIAADDRVLDERAPQIALSELGGSSVNMIVRPWTAKENYSGLKFDLTEQIKKRFDQEGINFPYPSQDVYIHNQNGE
jgi:small conductance mechanosensitive channel